MSFCIEKYAPLLAYNRITFITIDQVRANLQLEGQYVAKEKSVGTWNDYKAASGVVAFNHKVGQWLFLSRRAAITPADGMGVTGWFMNVFTEKNKIAPSQETVTCVFDKKTGLHKFWSEYTFMSEMTRSELKYFKDEKKLRYPLAIKKSGPQVYLEFVDPVTGNSQYSSDKFYRKDALEKYNSDENFRNAFDYVMDISVEQRITLGLFRLNIDSTENASDMSTKEEVLEDVSDTDNSEEIQDTDNSEEIQETDNSEEVQESNIDNEVTYESAFD